MALLVYHYIVGSADITSITGSTVVSLISLIAQVSLSAIPYNLLGVYSCYHRVIFSLNFNHVRGENHQIIKSYLQWLQTF